MVLDIKQLMGKYNIKLQIPNNRDPIYLYHHSCTKPFEKMKAKVKPNHFGFLKLITKDKLDQRGKDTFGDESITSDDSPIVIDEERYVIVFALFDQNSSKVTLPDARMYGLKADSKLLIAKEAEYIPVNLFTPLTACDTLNVF